MADVVRSGICPQAVARSRLGGIRSFHSTPLWSPSCSISVTTCRQSPLISPRVPAITAGLTWRATLRLLLLQGSACGLGIF